MKHLTIFIVLILLVPSVAAEFNPNMSVDPIKDNFQEGKPVKAEVDVSEKIWEREGLDLKFFVRGENSRSFRARENPGDTIKLGMAQSGNTYGVQVVKLGGTKYRDIKKVLQEETLDIKVEKREEREKRDKPGEFSINKINGKDADKVNEIPYHPDHKIEFDLEGIDESKYLFRIKIDGEKDIIPHDSNVLTPRSEIDRGTHTLKVSVIFRDEAVHSDTTQVKVTKVKGDGGREEIDTEGVEIVSINGEDADQINKIQLERNEIPIELKGIDTKEESFMIKLQGETLSRVEKGDTSFRPRKSSGISKEVSTLKATKRGKNGEQTIAETEVEITEIDLKRDKNTSINPDNIEIASINGENPDKTNDVSVTRDSPLELEMENFDLSEEKTSVKIGDERLPLIPDRDGKLKPRPKNDVTEGEQTLKVLYRIKGKLKTLDKTRVDIKKFSSDPGNRENSSSDTDSKTGNNKDKDNIKETNNNETQSSGGIFNSIGNIFTGDDNKKKSKNKSSEGGVFNSIVNFFS